MTYQRLVRATLLGLAFVVVWPMFEALGQRRRQPKSLATLAVKASIYYELGGVQPIPPTAFYVLDEDPEGLLSFLGEAPVISYAVAKVTGESLEIARMRIQVEQARNGYMREQLEKLLDAMRQTERLKAEAHSAETNSTQVITQLFLRPVRLSLTILLLEKSPTITVLHFFANCQRDKKSTY